MYRFAFRFVALAAASTNVAVNPDGSLEILEEDTSVVQMFETEDKQTVAPIPENTTVEPSLYWTPDFMRCCTQGGLAKCNLTQAELQDDQDRMEKSSISDIDCLNDDSSAPTFVVCQANFSQGSSTASAINFGMNQQFLGLTKSNDVIKLEGTMGTCQPGSGVNTFCQGDSWKYTTGVTAFCWSQASDFAPGDEAGTVFGTCQRIDTDLSYLILAITLKRNRADVVWRMSLGFEEDYENPTTLEEVALQYSNVDIATKKHVDAWTVEQMLLPAINKFCNYDLPLPNKTSDQTAAACSEFSDCIEALDSDYSKLMTYAQTVQQHSDKATLTTYITSAQAMQAIAQDKANSYSETNTMACNKEYLVLKNYAKSLELAATSKRDNTTSL